jgi:hypothetical protein
VAWGGGQNERGDYGVRGALGDEDRRGWVEESLDSDDDEQVRVGQGTAARDAVEARGDGSRQPLDGWDGGLPQSALVVVDLGPAGTGHGQTGRVHLRAAHIGLEACQDKYQRVTVPHRTPKSSTPRVNRNVKFCNLVIRRKSHCSLALGYAESHAEKSVRLSR